MNADIFPSWQEFTALYKQLRPAVRQRPGMYFGVSGPEALQRALQYLLHDLASFPDACRTRISLNQLAGSRIAIECEGASIVDQLLAALTDTRQFMDKSRSGKGGQASARLDTLIAAAACDSMRIILQGRRRSLTLYLGTAGCRIKETPRCATAGVQIIMQPNKETFGKLGERQLLALRGVLRDIAVLYPGLVTRLIPSAALPGVCWHYPDGVHSFLGELDYSRFNLHPKPIRLIGTQSGVRLTGAIRFVHAGNPTVMSWVNHHPSHGGGHLVGLGRAIEKLFPDSAAGCRVVSFIANPDTGETILLPHAFVAALHVEIANPRYSGPTKDILVGEEIQTAVERIATKSLMQQWHQQHPKAR